MLPPLRWVAEEALVYDEAANVLLRPGCPGHSSDPTSIELAPGRGAGADLGAQAVRDLSPDVTTAL